MQQFLSFWNAYNVTIIEVLIAIIVLTVAFLVYTLVFGKKDDALPDSVHIEKTLQKILEAQGGPRPTPVVSASSTIGDIVQPTDVSESVVGGGATDELARLRTSLQDKEAQLEQLKTTTAETAAAGGAVGGSATAGADTSGLEARIKELEGNLAEYEIISEDIADLSRYKEENSRLTKQLEALKSAAPAAAIAPAEPVAAAPADEIVEDPAMAAATAELTAPVIDESSEAPTEVAVEAPSVIDDELMKEFAAAVEGQKSSTVTNETDKLMNDFENFMKKG